MHNRVFKRCGWKYHQTKPNLIKNKHSAILCCVYLANSIQKICHLSLMYNYQHYSNLQLKLVDRRIWRRWYYTNKQATNFVKSLKATPLCFPLFAFLFVIKAREKAITFLIACIALAYILHMQSSFLSQQGICWIWLLVLPNFYSSFPWDKK